MAVVALGGVGITQRTDLSVEGVLVAVKLVHMAIAAIGRHRQFEGVARSVGDAVCRVAIGADCGLCQQLLAVFLAVHRAQVGLKLLGMATGAADRWNLQAPLCALRAPLGRDVETVCVVTVVTPRIGLIPLRCN